MVFAWHALRDENRFGNWIFTLVSYIWRARYILRTTLINHKNSQGGRFQFMIKGSHGVYCRSGVRMHEMYFKKCIDWHVHPLYSITCLKIDASNTYPWLEHSATVRCVCKKRTLSNVCLFAYLPFCPPVCLPTRLPDTVIVLMYVTTLELSISPKYITE